METKVNIYSKVSLSLEDNNCLMLLYLPLIGSEPVILYEFLNALLDKQTLTSKTYTIDELLTLLGWKLKKFTDSRSRLEAIGLLETYADRNNNYKLFIKSPLTYKNFIKDCTFGIYLKSKISEPLFNKIAQNAMLPNVSIKDDTNISKHFEEVFTFVLDEAECIDGNFRGRKPSRGANISTDGFDLDLFISKIDSNYMRDGLTAELEKKFTATQYTYGLTMEQMINLYNESVTNDGVFKIDTFVKKAINTFNYLNDNHKLKFEEKDKSNDVIDIFASKSAHELLLELSGDETFVSLNINKVRKIYETLDYEPGIINFMIMKVYKDKRSIPSLNYFVKISETWKENGIYSVEDAYKYTTTGEYPLNNNKRVNHRYNTNNKGYELEDWQKDALNDIWKEENFNG